MLHLLYLLLLLTGLDHRCCLSLVLFALKTVEPLFEDADLVLEIAYLTFIAFNLSGLHLALSKLRVFSQ